MRYFLLTIILLFSGVVYAAENTFIVRTTVGTDTDPPTVPANLSATAVSSSQIDLSWDPSTDNLLLGGYQVFRGGTQIATTTLTTYSDTGLASSTLYTYEVTAFDSVYNVSSSSLPAATTTLGSITIPSSSGSGGDSLESVATEIIDFTVSPTRNSADISFNTNVYTAALFRWGRTQNYEEGYSASNIFRKSHKTTITELEPGTLYELEIILTRRFSGEPLIHTVQFTTDAMPDVVAPPNVTNVRAVLKNGHIELTWSNPEVADFSHVRVVGNNHFYPVDPLDGWFVYENSGERAEDTHEGQYSTRFYTIFAYDNVGNRSSGAVVSMKFDRSDTDISGPSKLETSVADPYAGFSFSDISITQNGLEHAVIDDLVTVDRQFGMSFSIPYALLPKHLKTIVITLTNPKDTRSQFSFLLAINKDRTAYEATIGQLPLTGTYVTSVEIFDYKTQTITRVHGEVVAVDTNTETTVSSIDTVTEINWPLISVLLCALLLLLYLFLWRRFR